jgi:hypothetical protein
MSITIEQLPDEPIVIMKFEGSVTATEITEKLQEVAEQTADIPGTIYRINDISDLKMTIKEMVSLVHALRQPIPGAYNDPRFEVVFVNNNRTSQLYTDILQTQLFRDQPIRLFDSIAEAIEYIRQRDHETA